MTPEIALDRLATAVHQAVQDLPIPEALVDAPVLSLTQAHARGLTVVTRTARVAFPFDLMWPRDVLASEVADAVKALAEVIESELESESASGVAQLVHLDHASGEGEDPEPALLLDRLAVWAGLLEGKGGRWRGSVRAYFGITTPTD